MQPHDVSENPKLEKAAKGPRLSWIKGKGLDASSEGRKYHTDSIIVLVTSKRRKEIEIDHRAFNSVHTYVS